MVVYPQQIRSHLLFTGLLYQKMLHSLSDRVSSAFQQRGMRHFLARLDRRDTAQHRTPCYTLTTSRFAAARQVKNISWCCAMTIVAIVGYIQPKLHQRIRLLILS